MSETNSHNSSAVVTSTLPQSADENASTAAATSSEPAPSSSRRRPYDMTQFRLIQILNNNSGRKMVCCLGHFTDLSETDEALVIFEKTAFTKKHLVGAAADDEGANVSANSITENEANDGNGCSENNGSTAGRPKGFFTDKSLLRESFVNDIYGNFELFPDPEINSKIVAHIKVHFISFFFLQV